jgi:hypothetical protein
MYDAFPNTLRILCEEIQILCEEGQGKIRRKSGKNQGKSQERKMAKMKACGIQPGSFLPLQDIKNCEI